MRSSSEFKLSLLSLLRPKIFRIDIEIKDIKNKTLSKEGVKKIGFPLVESVVQRSLIATGGTVLASKLAIKNGVACNTAGGIHHANFDSGAGYWNNSISNYI